MSSTDRPYLSVVVASRNDDHGGDPLRRTQIFVNVLFAQCRKHRLPAELIVVDWNPPPDRPGLHEAIAWDRQDTYCAVRVIRVPSSLHEPLKHSTSLPLFQMIAKNVGIRRARGEFVLATNIDIIFSDELMAYISSRRLNPECMYRVDRHDVPNTLPLEASTEEQLEFCWRNPIRFNRRGETLLPTDIPCPSSEQLRAQGVASSAGLQPNSWQELEREGEYSCLVTQNHAPIECLHTNACGDFTLLSKEKWEGLHGYPEFEAYSFHLDSVFCYMAHFDGICETFMPSPCVTFHIEHQAGSGWSPEGSQALFERLEKAGIPYLEYEHLVHLAKCMQSEGKATVFNSDSWGLARFQLEEIDICNGQPVPRSHPSSFAFPSAGKHNEVQQSESGKPLVYEDSSPPLQVSSVLPEFEFETLQKRCLLAENRRLKKDQQHQAQMWHDHVAETAKYVSRIEKLLQKHVEMWHDHEARIAQYVARIEELERSNMSLEAQWNDWQFILNLWLRTPEWLRTCMRKFITYLVRVTSFISKPRQRLAD